MLGGGRCVHWRIFSLPAENGRNNAQPTGRNRLVVNFPKRETKFPAADGGRHSRTAGDALIILL